MNYVDSLLVWHLNKVIKGALDFDKALCNGDKSI